jgi:hypothetical protein
MEIPLSFVHPRFLKRKDSLLTSAPCSLDELKAILSKSPAIRSENDLKALVSFTRSIKFFTELREKAGESGLIQCCRKLLFQSYPAGKVMTQLDGVSTGRPRGFVLYYPVWKLCSAEYYEIL